MVAVDTIAFTFILLSLLLYCYLCVSFLGVYSFEKYVNFTHYYLLLVFSCYKFLTVFDLLLFYIAFEAILIPMFLIIGVWGSRAAKIGAAYKFFMYTLLGVSWYVVIIVIYLFRIGIAKTFLLYCNCRIRLLIFLCKKFYGFLFFVAFAVKLPFSSVPCMVT